MKTFLVIRFSSLGDILLTSPFLLNLKIAHPDSRILFLCKDRFADAVKLLEPVDQILTIPSGIPLPAYLYLLMHYDDLRIDTIYDLQGNLRSWWARKIISATEKYIYPKRRLERTLAVKKKIIPATVPHTIDLYQQTLRDSNLNVHAEKPRTLIPDSFNNDTCLEFIERNKTYIVIAPEATHPPKQYPLENFITTAQSLQEDSDIGIIWFYLTEKTETALKNSSLSSKRNLYCHKYSLKDISYIMHQAQMTLSNDSGLMHLSSGVGTLVIALFGPTHPVLGFSPEGCFDSVVQVDEPCRPCSLHGKAPCYRDKQYCFERIEPGRLANHVKHKLKEKQNVNRAVFLDRDGTLIKDKHFLSDPDKIEFEDHALEGMKLLQSLDLKIIIVSNQSGVARQKFSIDTVETMNRHLMEMLSKHNIYPDAIYYCPHHPLGADPTYGITCRCRKPSPGMAESAMYQFNLNLRKSFMIGDKLDDVNFGKVIGAKPVLVKTGYGKKHLETLKSTFYNNVAVSDNLLSAAQIIEKSMK